MGGAFGPAFFALFEYHTTIMATQDIYSRLAAAESLQHQAHTSTTNGSEVDLVGFEAALFVVTVSAYTDGTHVLDFGEAPDDGTGSSGTFSTISDDDLLFDASLDQVDADGQITIDASGDTGVYHVGYIGQERFIRGVISSQSNVTSGATYGINIVKGIPRRAPTNDVQRS